MIDEIKILAQKGHEIYSNISEKLAQLPTDLELVGNFKQMLSKEQSVFKQKIEEVQLKLTSPTLEQKDLDFTEENKGISNSWIHVQFLYWSKIVHFYSIFILEFEVAVWRIADSLIRLKKIIVDAVESWNMRLSEALRKRETDKKKEKTVELDSPGNPEQKPLLSEVGSCDQSDQTYLQGMSKKIKSLDQSESKLILIHFCYNNFKSDFLGSN